MPRENSLTDSVGRSLTPDLEEEPAIASPESIQPAQHPRFEDANGHEREHRFDIASLVSGRSKRSFRARFLSHDVSTTVTVHPHPKERFRKLVHKVIAMHRGTTLISSRTIGAEPGIDPRKSDMNATYQHLQEDCDIEVVDYSAVRSNSRRLNNKEFVDLMQAKSDEREPWVRVRWINIGGMSWNVFKAVSIKYDLHPLALESVLLSHSQNRSKAEYYPQHLFLHVVCHELGDGPVTSSDDDDDYTDVRTSSPVPMSDFNPSEKGAASETDVSSNLKSAGINKFKSIGKNSLLPVSRVDVKEVVEEKQPTLTHHSRRFTMLSTRETKIQAQRKENKKNAAIIALLKSESRVHVDVSSMFFFLMRDGTVISFRPTPNLSFTAPISYRLKSRDTLLRKSADASLLLYALIDLIVDNAIQVVDQYNIKIQKYERDVLLSLHMSTVRELHILSGDLAMYKRSLEPIKTLIYALRRYDDDRAAALIDFTDTGSNLKDVKVKGFMSAKSKIYLADSYDHMEYVLSSFDTFAGIAENLIAFSFNIKSYEMNNVMRRLTVTTIIFLPLSFLTGYFGMNFMPFPAIMHTDLFFWKIALPILAVVIVVALWMDLKQLWSSLTKKREIKKQVR